jgi:hypothetical protein
MHPATAPVSLGAGESRFAGLDLPTLGDACTERVSTPAATHLTVTKQRRHVSVFPSQDGYTPVATTMPGL